MRDLRTRIGIIVTLAAGLLQACAMAPRSEAPTPAPTPDTNVVRQALMVEAWRGVNVPPTVAWQGPRAAVYTYVLVGDVGGRQYDGSNSRIVQARRSLGEILKELHALQPATNLHDEEIKRANLFCIPSSGGPTEPVDEQNFDFDLAAQYRNAFRLLLAEDAALLEHLMDTGPFLVATRAPISDILAGAPREGREQHVAVLLIDLSGAHPRAMPVYVKEFEKSVRRKEVSESEVLTPLRPALVSALLIANEAIPFVGEASARVRQSLGSGAKAPAAPKH